jgi:hypothetical protein
MPPKEKSIATPRSSRCRVKKF